MIADSGDGHHADDVVYMRTPAQASQLRLIRLVAADLGGQLDFDVEAISELRMAVDEACAQLVGAAAENASLHCAFRMSIDGLELTVSTKADRDTVLEETVFGWRVLAAFADSVESLHGAVARPADVADTDEFWIGIRLSKQDDRTG